MLDTYDKFLKDLNKETEKNFKKANDVPSQEVLNIVLLSEQNTILKQLGVALALISDELHELNNKPVDLAEEDSSEEG